MDFSDDDDALVEAMDVFDRSTQNLDVDRSVQYVTSEMDEADEDGEKDKHLQVLLSSFGHKAFRQLQWKIIRSILVDKRDNCAIMTTGYGKSLCYQFPSVYSNGITFVISPLISLMEDQVLGLTALNINACLLGTAQESKYAQIHEEIIQGYYRLVYMTPEFITGELGLELLKETEDQLTLVAIDEAHCVSSWGHDFRSAFRRLACIRWTVPSVPIIALTATATKCVVDDIIKTLRLKNPLKLCSGFDRPNLKLTVKLKANCWTDLSKIFHEHQEGSVIIYCLKRKDTTEMVQLLKSHRIDCAAYHAGLSMKVRRAVHGQFAKDQLRVIVATIAFGMGIDKPDVRVVIHYGASKDIESYYQELGRAGRDGLPAKCITFYDRKDFEFHGFMRDTSRNETYKKNQEKLTSNIQKYVAISSCRRKFILNYFGDPNEQHLTIHGECCDNCDRMLSKEKRKIEYEGFNDQNEYNFEADARLLLTAMEAVGPYYGINRTILVLMGSKSKKLQDSLIDLPIHGAGRNKKEDWWKAVFDLLQRHGFVEVFRYTAPGTNKFANRTRISVTVAGKRWLQDRCREPLYLTPTPEMFGYFKIKVDAPKCVQSLDDFKKDPKSAMQPFVEQKPLTLEETIVKKLKRFRYELASKMDGMPYMIASETCIRQMAELRPTTIEQMTEMHLDQFPNSKIQLYGQKFIDFIAAALVELKDKFPATSAGSTTTPVPLEDPSTSIRISEDPPAASTSGNQTLLLDDEADEEILRLEGKLFQSLMAVPTQRAPDQPPPAKRQMLSKPKAECLVYDDSSSDDGEANDGSSKQQSQPRPLQQNRITPTWLSTRRTATLAPASKAAPRSIDKVL